LTKILFLSQLLPYPPDAGAKVRSFYTLRYLAQKHQVTLLAFIRPGDPQSGLDYLKEICEEVHTVPIQRKWIKEIKSLAVSLVNGKSFIIQRDNVPEMASKLTNLLENRRFDAVHADQLWMAQYAIKVKSSVPGIKLVLDEHNACYMIFKRLAEIEQNPIKRLFFEHEWRKLQRYEMETCAEFDHIVTVTQVDRDLLSRLLAEKGVDKHQATFSTIPICVDTQEIKTIRTKGQSYGVFHLGTMIYLPNITGILWFVHEVWPQILAKAPLATLTIAGKNPPPKIKKLENINHHEAIRITGYLPDPIPYLEDAGVFIVPLLAGGGMRVKIIDAWRWGLPVVSTSIGAEGIDYIDGKNILIADSAEDFANAVVRVITEPDLAQRLRVNGRQWVEQHYEWRKVYPVWDAIYPNTN
jgi:polysaccharide biosynthesis protein PslH